jgi:hypothetical protein
MLPQILYVDEQFTPGQRAGLNAACQCFVAPYRGEGFGLPILEAMACGLPVIVPAGGASDNFVTAETGWLLPSQEVETTHPWPLAGPALELSIDPHDLRRTMRRAYEDRRECRRRGEAAANLAGQFTWQRTAAAMTDRLRQLARSPGGVDTNGHTSAQPHKPTEKPHEQHIAACLLVQDDERQLPECLARITPFVDQVVVCDHGSHDRSLQIAREYGAIVVSPSVKADEDADRASCLTQVTTPWVLWLRPQDHLAEEDAGRIRALVAAQPAFVDELTMTCTGRRPRGNAQAGRKLHLVRCRNGSHC